MEYQMVYWKGMRANYRCMKACYEHIIKKKTVYKYFIVIIRDKT